MGWFIYILCIFIDYTTQNVSLSQQFQHPLSWLNKEFKRIIILQHRTAKTFGLVMYFFNYCFQCSLSMNTLKPFGMYYSSKWADCPHTLNSCSCVDCTIQYLYLFYSGIKNPYHRFLENKPLSFPRKCKLEWVYTLSGKY